MPASWENRSVSSEASQDPTQCSSSDEKDQPIHDKNNPKQWPNRKKWSNFIVVAMNAFIGYFSSAIYMPALESIRAYFGTSTVVINATIATYILCTGIAPLFWAPFSERVGRRWVYISAMVLFIVCSIICSIAKSIGLFFVFRMLQGFFASAGQAVGGGSVADLFESKERGRAMSIYILGTILGPAFSPIIGGYVDQYLNWQWIFYIKAILGAVIAVLTFIFVQETLYVPSDGILSSTSSDPISWKQRLQNLKFNPFASLEFLLRPEVLLVCIPLSTSFGWFYFLVTILPETYSQIYHFSTGSIGLCYLAGGVGNTSGSIVAGLVSDRVYAWQVARHHGVHKQEYRLTPLYLGIPFLVIGSLLYGWFLHFHLHWFTPLIGYCLTTFGIMFTITIGNTYLVESFITRSASVVSTNNFTRNIMATIFSLLAVNIRSGVGDGIAYTLMAVTNLVAYVVCIALVQVYGTQWRAAKPWWKNSKE